MEMSNRGGISVKVIVFIYLEIGGKFYVTVSSDFIRRSGSRNRYRTYRRYRKESYG